MNAIARRGIVCCLGLSLCGATLYGQETSGEDPKQKEPQNLGAHGEEYVQKLRNELKARLIDHQKVQAQLKQAEAAREKLAAELQAMREALEAIAVEKQSVEDRARKQVDEIAGRMRQMIAHKRDDVAQGKARLDAAQQGENTPRPDNVPLDRQIESARRDLEAAARATAAEAMKRAANTLDNVARQAEGAASRLDQAGPDSTSNNVDESWKRLMERADFMLEQSRRNEEVAAQYLPKLESAVTQLRKAGRDQAADELMVVANTLLGRGAPPPNMPRDDARPDNVRRDGRQTQSGSDVKQAIDDLRREVEQLRGEVHELRHLLQRGKAGEPNAEDRTERSAPAGAVMVTIAANAEGRPTVHLADGEKRITLDPTHDEHEIRETIARAIREGRNTIFVQSDANVRHTDLVQVVRLASIQGATVHVNVPHARVR